MDLSPDLSPSRDLSTTSLLWVDITSEDSRDREDSVEMAVVIFQLGVHINQRLAQLKRLLQVACQLCILLSPECNHNSSVTISTIL